jgi:hypothetical protein
METKEPGPLLNMLLHDMKREFASSMFNQADIEDAAWQAAHMYVPEEITSQLALLVENPWLVKQMKSATHSLPFDEALVIGLENWCGDWLKREWQG